MKNIIYILLSLFLCSSCYKEPIEDPYFSAELNIVHLESSIQHIDALIADEQAFAYGLGHYEQSGYNKLPANDWVELLVTQSGQSNILLRETKQFEEDQRYTLLFYSSNGGTRSLWLDDVNQPSASTAFVRLINLVESNNTIQKEYRLQSSNEVTLPSDNPTINTTDFVAASAEPTIFTITDDANSDIKTETAALNLIAGHQYTIIVQGDGNQISSFVWEH